MNAVGTGGNALGEALDFGCTPTAPAATATATATAAATAAATATATTPRSASLSDDLDGLASGKWVAQLRTPGSYRYQMRLVTPLRWLPAGGQMCPWTLLAVGARA